AYQLDKTMADAVLDQRRQEQFNMAEYTASGVATVPSRTGIDGGMHPIFMAKLSTHNGFDNNGRIFELPGNTVAPGALPRVPNPPSQVAQATQPPKPQPSVSAPVVLASVPLPQPAPRPKQGEAPPAQEKPASIAGLIGNLFGGSTAEAAPSAPPPEPQQVATRSTELAARPKPAAPTHTASAPVHTASAAAAPVPKAAAETPRSPAPKPAPQQTAKAEPPRP